MSGDVFGCHGQLEDTTVMGEQRPGLLKNLQCAGIHHGTFCVPDVSSVSPVSLIPNIWYCHTFQNKGGFRISVYYGDIMGLGFKSKHETH